MLGLHFVGLLHSSAGPVAIACVVVCREDSFYHGILHLGGSKRRGLGIGVQIHGELVFYKGVRKGTVIKNKRDIGFTYL